jgi:glycosyltransferase involved in cell wall biosynthesis
LLIIGREGWKCTDILERLHKEDPLVRWLKYVPSDDLPSILRCASGLVFPSLYEGFGLPVLEAFAAELPVITSNVTSLPEVAGNAALLVDPYDCENITWAMQTLIEDTALARNLQQAGLCRAREFTWDRTAQATIDIYRRLGSRT